MTKEAFVPVVDVTGHSDVTAVNPSEEDVVCTKITECIINYDAKVAEHPSKEKAVETLESYVALEPTYPVRILEDTNNSLYVPTSKIVCDEAISLHRC